MTETLSRESRCKPPIMQNSALALTLDPGLKASPVRLQLGCPLPNVSTAAPGSPCLWAGRRCGCVVSSTQQAWNNWTSPITRDHSQHTATGQPAALDELFLEGREEHPGVDSTRPDTQGDVNGPSRSSTCSRVPELLGVTQEEREEPPCRLRVKKGWQS